MWWGLHGVHGTWRVMLWGERETHDFPIEGNVPNQFLIQNTLILEKKRLKNRVGKKEPFPSLMKNIAYFYLQSDRN